MDISTAQRTLEAASARTAELYKQFLKNGDQERADKAALFLQKLHGHEFVVAFCGHFSAGKSTMINELTGEALLPSSPIPTSANIVKIRPAAEDFAKIYYHHDRPLLFKAPYDIKHVKRFAKNGDEVAAIEIGHAHSHLPEGVTVMDTPGVDSTDDAHRISTESALHLADMVFYVMDYNHVQSELNFIYTKELLDHGAKLYLIINQIDKHRDEELSFPAFQQSVYESFAAWNVHPEAFFFTSLRSRDFPGNDFAEVQTLIQRSIEHREELAAQSAETMMKRLAAEHMAWLTEQQQEQTAEWKALVAEAGEAPIEEKEARLQEELDKRDASFWLKAYEERRDRMLKNAILMPAGTRELARSFVESVQADFKVGGLFFAKRKTEEEREERLTRFVADLQKQTEAQVNWHLRQESAGWLKESGLDDPSLSLKAEELAAPVDAALVREAVKPGAGTTGEAILNYADEVAALVKKRARRVSDEWIAEAEPMLRSQFADEFAAFQAEHAIWHKRLQAKQSLEVMERELQKQKQQLQKAIESETAEAAPILARLAEKWQQEQEDVSVYTGQEKMEEVREQEIIEKAPAASEVKAGDAQKAVARLRQLADRLGGVPGFARFVDGALQKAARLDNRTYTIALFGAFSAGKSSFANALLGEKVLPVSPNPTTAAVNRIHPVSETKQHRTADVHLKQAAVMLADVNASLGLFNQQADSLEAAVHLIPSVLQANEGEGTEKIHLSFLRAFTEGYSDYAESAGHTLTVDLQTFKDYVATEQKSCFVDSIDLYYDCEFTQLGITLVDTPGADSINARHTGVAFEYIKNSDAILFVTYYNHAFSKADREFLIQLGRVKDAFELDKMFFMINAIDLASNEEELAEVKQYVHDQLAGYGIRFPRLHGVSSMLAVEEAARGEWHHPQSGMGRFKESFRSFLSHDLVQMSVQSAEAEANRGVKQLAKLVETAKESRGNREQKKADLEEKWSRLSEMIQAETTDVEKKRMSQELDELVYYIKQRVFYRFSDFFKESFNPAVLNDKQNIQLSLQKALEELLQSVGYDLAQEMRATTIRTENHGLKLLKEKQSRFVHRSAMIEPELLLSDAALPALSVPEFPTAFQQVARERFSKPLSLFKNAKAFFEKNEKQLMMEQLQTIIESLADEYLAEQKAVLQESAHGLIEDGTKEIKQFAALDVNEQMTAWLEALEQSENIDEWEKILADIS